AHVCVLGGSPNDTSQPQNIFVRVLSWTWISSPMTGSRLSDTRARSIEFERSLERVRDVEEPVLAECGTSDLKADWKPAGQAAGNRDRGDAGERHGDGAVVVEVHRDRVCGLLAELERDARRRRRDDEVDELECLAEVLGDLRAHALRAAVVRVVVPR